MDIIRNSFSNTKLFRRQFQDALDTILNYKKKKNVELKSGVSMTTQAINLY